jgi:hypothetical protein
VIAVGVVSCNAGIVTRFNSLETFMEHHRRHTMRSLQLNHCGGPSRINCGRPEGKDMFEVHLLLWRKTLKPIAPGSGRVRITGELLVTG